MFRKLAWFVSIVLISLCFFSFSWLEYSDRNLLFSSKEKIQHRQEAVIYKRAVEWVLFRDFSSLVRQIRTNSLVSGPKAKREIRKIFAKNSDWLTNLTVRRIKPEKTLFTTQALKKEEDTFYPCVDNFYYLPNEDSFLICKSDVRTQTFLHLSLEGIRQRIMLRATSRPRRQKTIFPIQSLILQGRDIFLNIPESVILKKRELLAQTQMLFFRKIPFQMYWRGIPIYSKEIPDFSRKNSSSSYNGGVYHLYYHPLFARRPLSTKQIFEILFSAFLGFLTLYLGFRNYFRKSSTEEQIVFVDNKIFSSLGDDQEEKFSVRDSLSSNLSEKERLELQDLITQVTDLNLSSISPSSSIEKKEFFNQIEASSSSIFSDFMDDNHSLNILLQEFPEIFYTLKCSVEKEWVQISAFHRMEPQFHYHIPSSRFIIPQLTKKTKPDVYIYKEAGKTTAIKFLLHSSIIDPLMIQAALAVQISELEFYIHLFKDSQDPETAARICVKTKSL